ncbi:hypothetical protein MTR67_053301 [Solanum verrucosum]|uniref:Uncharacterized protein n=1 Tax=Solanum verrucosum TaxID=315347 RepID=A0AAF0VAD3_SOLVR|nr:hypothetical protein MTR67_053301 [Solanum verrucosum]
MNGGMRLHSFISQVDFEREHGIPFMYSNSHTRAFNVLMPVGLHRIMMQTHVTRINIQRLVDKDDRGYCPDIPLVLEAS